MNKSDKYYLKQGKLELSMLEDDEDDGLLVSKPSEPKKNEAFGEKEFPHTKRLRDTRIMSSGNIKVTQDIYNTLHTMGQFLTKTDSNTSTQKNIAPKKNINSAKAQILEQIASTVKIQDVALPPMKSEEVQSVKRKEDNGEPFESISEEEQKQTLILPKREEIEQIAEVATRSEISLNELATDERADENIDVPNSPFSEPSLLEQSKEIEKTILNEELEKLLQQDEAVSSDIRDAMEGLNHTSEVINDAANTDQDVSESPRSNIDNQVEEVYNLQQTRENRGLLLEDKGSDKELSQNKIDAYVNDYFGEVKPKYIYARELKKRIDKVINLIRNYE